MGEASVVASAPVMPRPLAEDPPSMVPPSLGLPLSSDGKAAAAMPAFELVVTCTEEAITVAVCGELDMEAAPMLAQSLESFSGPHRGTSFAIDLERMSFVDAAGLRAFVPSIRRLAVQGQRLVVRRPSALALTVLALSGLAPALSIER